MSAKQMQSSMLSCLLSRRGSSAFPMTAAIHEHSSHPHQQQQSSNELVTSGRPVVAGKPREGILPVLDAMVGPRALRPNGDALSVGPLQTHARTHASTFVTVTTTNLSWHIDLYDIRLAQHPLGNEQHHMYS